MSEEDFQGNLDWSQWQAIDTPMSSPDDAYGCVMSCNVYSVNSCTVRFDDVQLYEGLRWKTYHPTYAYADTGTIGGGEDVADLGTDDGQYFTVQADSTNEAGTRWKTDWYGQVQINEERTKVKRLWVGYDGHYSTGDVENPKVQNICLMNFDTEVWDTLCATSDDESCENEIRRADITHGWSTADTSEIRDYISPNRYIQLRVVTEDTTTYNCLADYMRFSVQYEPQ